MGEKGRRPMRFEAVQVSPQFVVCPSDNPSRVRLNFGIISVEVVDDIEPNITKRGESLSRRQLRNGTALAYT
jgi:hypothetical protein